MEVFYASKPEKYLYMKRPDSTYADVWLRNNIQSYTNDMGENGYTADENYILTELTEQEVADQFDTLFLVANHSTPTIEDRISALEDAVLSLGGE